MVLEAAVDELQTTIPTEKASPKVPKSKEKFDEAATLNVNIRVPAPSAGKEELLNTWIN